MQIRLSSRPLGTMKVDLAVCFAYEGDKKPRGVEGALAREIARQMKADGFRGQAGDRLVWSGGDGGPRRVALLGLGRRRTDADRIAEAIRLGAARAVGAAADHRAKTLGLRLPPAGGRRGEDIVRAAAEGLRLGAYRFEGYLTDTDRKVHAPDRAELASDAKNARRALKAAEAGAGAVCLARDLVNEPPSELDPPTFARRARAVAREAKLTCRVLGPADLKRERMGAMLAVARGAAAQPRLVHATYKPKRKAAAAPRVLLVGKGVTFDSGGLDLKPPDYMTTMKCDMGGAAAVLGAISALPALGVGAEVHAVLGLVENMTGGAAYKPGDILKTRSGKTVEVGNTDAEGRLVLCDCLDWAIEKIKPTHVIDVATLTGACVVALGPRATGLFTRFEELGDALLGAAARAGEKLWPLPMYEEYLAMLQKGPADLNNVGGRYGGAITAALFLAEFVPADLTWAHLDIAGPAFTEKDLPDAQTGGTGAGTLALIRWLETL